MPWTCPSSTQSSVTRAAQPAAERSRGSGTIGSGCGAPGSVAAAARQAEAARAPRPTLTTRCHRPFSRATAAGRRRAAPCLDPSTGHALPGVDEQTHPNKALTFARGWPWRASARSGCPPCGRARTASGELLHRPAVAVRIAEEEERAPVELLDLADLDPRPTSSARAALMSEATSCMPCTEPAWRSGSLCPAQWSMPTREESAERSGSRR